MPVTSKTYSLRGDLNKSTNVVKTHSVLPFYVYLTATQELSKSDVLADGVVDRVIDISDLETATFVVIEIDPELDGHLKFKFNGSADEIIVKKFLVLFDTEITEMSVSNDSGNEAGYSMIAGAE